MSLIYPASEAEWHGLRRKHVGSTESPALFGISPYMTAFELAVAKKENISLFRENERTKWGQRLQGVIADAFEEEYGARVERADHRYYTIEEVRAGCTIDHIIHDVESDGPMKECLNKHGPGILEIKNVDKWEFHEKWADGEAPPHIELQIQHQMTVTGYKWGCIFAFVGGNNVMPVYRTHEPQIGERIIESVNDFWTKIGNGILPPPELPEDAAIMCKLYGKVEPEKVYDAREDECLRGLVRDYKVARASATKYEADAKSLQATILSRINDAERVINCGSYSIWAGRVEGGHVEYEREGYRGFKVTEKKRGKN
jgi:putative phage-type endonuclease